jgi:PKD repeat protein
MKRNILNLLLFALISILAAGGCTEKELGNPLPSTVANFEISTISNQGYAPFDVSFTNLSLNATGYTWDFGNGLTSTEENPTTHYETPGLYNVTLTCGSANELHYNELVKTLVVNAKDPLAGLTQVLYYTTRTAGPAGVFMVVLNDNAPIVQEFETTEMIRPYGIAVDTGNSKVYVSDYSLGMIYRFDADGKNPLKILDRATPGLETMLSDPEGIVVVQDKVYWGNPGGIYRANLDGTSPELYIDTQGLPPEYPLDLDYDHLTDRLYLVNDMDSYSGGYYSCKMDGSDMQTHLAGIDGTALEVDPDTEKAYLVVYAGNGTDIIDRGIYMCNIDGTSCSLIGDFGAKATWGIAIDHERGKLFWGYKMSNADPDGKIIRSNLDGSQQEDWIININPVALDIAWVKL